MVMTQTEMIEDLGGDDCWIGSEFDDILVTQTTPPEIATSPKHLTAAAAAARSKDRMRRSALDESFELLNRSEPLELPRAFELLQSFRCNDSRALGRLAVRSTGSPLVPSKGTSYVVCRRLCDATSTISPDTEAIPVSFQSILNSDVWWSASRPGEGVASRPMSRGTRAPAKSGRDDVASTSSSEERQSQTHGYRGRMYTLVARTPGFSAENINGEQRTKRQRGSSSTKPRYVAVGDISIVHAWRASQEEAFSHAAANHATAPAAAAFASDDAYTSSATTSSDGPAFEMPPPRADEIPSTKRRIDDERSSATVSAAPPADSSLELTTASQNRRAATLRTESEELLSLIMAAPLRRPAPRTESEELLSATGLTPRDSIDEEVVDSLFERTAADAANQKDAPSTVPTTNAQPHVFAPLGGDGLRGGGRTSHFNRDAMYVDRTLRVRGDVHVDGFIFGQLATAPKAADYAEWFQWDDRHLDFAANGDVVGSPPPGTVTQLRSPEQKLTLDTTGGAGPVLIVSTSPSVAAGIPVDPRQADHGALVAFLGQVPVRCRGIVRCGDQLVPSGLGDGTAVAFSADDYQFPQFVDALGVAMEDSPTVKNEKEKMKEEDAMERGEGEGLLCDEKEHTILCFVRWNHAVRRELKDEMGKVVIQMHGTMLSVLVYATAFVSAGVVALLFMLLIIFTADKTSGDADRSVLERHGKRLRSWILFLGLVALFCLLALVFTFTTAIPYLKLLSVSGLVVISFRIACAETGDNATLTAFLILFALLYHALLCFSALKLRRDQTKPNSCVTCSPTCLTWARRIFPCCCIIAIFFCIFAI